MNEMYVTRNLQLLGERMQMLKLVVRLLKRGKILSVFLYLAVASRKEKQVLLDFMSR
jgi:hypothetical protein